MSSNAGGGYEQRDVPARYSTDVDDDRDVGGNSLVPPPSSSSSSSSRVVAPSLHLIPPSRPYRTSANDEYPHRHRTRGGDGTGGGGVGGVGVASSWPNGRVVVVDDDNDDRRSPHLSCSPMISVPRRAAHALRLPDLYLREARRRHRGTACEFGDGHDPGRRSFPGHVRRERRDGRGESRPDGPENNNDAYRLERRHGGRGRSRSMGSDRDGGTMVDGTNTNDSPSSSSSSSSALLLLLGRDASDHTSIRYPSSSCEGSPLLLFGEGAKSPSGRSSLMNPHRDDATWVRSDGGISYVDRDGGGGGCYGSTTTAVTATIVHGRKSMCERPLLPDIPRVDVSSRPSNYDRSATAPTTSPPPSTNSTTMTSSVSIGPNNNGGRAEGSIIDDDDDYDDDDDDNGDDPLLRDLRRDYQMQSNAPMASLLYGLINTTIVLPIVMSFGSIIYRDDFFRPYLSGLIQLTIVSGAIHQISFSTFSTLPFAVGSVQDAGLIFLSSMSSNLVKILRKDGADDATILATVTIGLGIYTALLGLALILVGRFRLASYCKLLPSSVVGGYLGYIGFFCGQAGLALMAEVDVSGLTEWGKFLDVDALVLMTPGVIGGFVVYYSVRTFRHMAVLPTCIVMLMIMFYAALWATGTNVRDATEYGWINRNFNDSPAWYHTWEYLRVEKVVWTALPSQALTLVAMICVVSLSSSLDIAAIEIELRRPLDYNHELKTVGISNIISGLTGGYTGSYIFSQSIFSLKMGIRSRLMGYVLAFTMLAFWMIPIDVLCYVPNFFFGSMLLMICLDLMFEWLIDVRGELTSAEYATVLATFALLQILGLEFGIIAGCVLHFAMLRMGYDIGNDESVNMDDVVAIANYKACNSKREIVRPEGRR